MMLRDRMVYGGIQTSRRMARLTWMQRDFFRGLLHVADDYGRFEADAEMLRAVLYGPMLSKVSVRDVQEALMRCAASEIGLVKLYTVEGRGYGKVYNFRQTLMKRRALYPDEDGAAQEPELFPAGAPEPPPPERKKEGKSPQPPAAAGGSITSSFSPEPGPSSAPAVRYTRRRSPERTLAASRDELEEVEKEMTEILYPGGCAHKVAPTGQKLNRFNELAARRKELKAAANAAREQLQEVNEH